MKIQSEHYQTLKQLLENQVKRWPEFELYGQLEGHRPERVRWDVLHRTGLKIGDDAGMADPGDGTPYLPLYAYMNDNHIDTALRNAMHELGCEYAARSANVHAKPAPFDAGKRVLSDGQFMAQLLNTGTGEESVCLVTKNGSVVVEAEARAKLVANPDSFVLKDVGGGTHKLAMEGSVSAYLPAYEAFFARQSEYVVRECEVLYAPGSKPDDAPQAVIEDDKQVLTFDQLQGQCSKLGVKEFGGQVLFADAKERPDGSASVRFYKVEAVNGVSEYIEPEIHAAAAAMGFKQAPELQPDMKLKTSGPALG